MADTLARINLLTGTKASIETATETGTPGIATDYAHRLGWLSGGSFKWAAVSGTAESFASIKAANLTAGVVPVAGTAGLLQNSNISDDGTTITLYNNVKLNNLGSGKVPVRSPATGNVTDSAFGDDGTTATCTRPLTVTGGKTTLAPAAAGYASLNIPTSAAVPTSLVSGDVFASTSEIFSYGLGVTSIRGASDTVGGGSFFQMRDSISSQTKGWIYQLGASNDLAFWNYNGGWTRKAQISQAGAITCRTSEPVVSGLTASTSSLSYTNSTTPTSIIAAGALTIAAGRWGVAGTIWTALAMGTIQWTNAHTLRIEVLLGATVIADSGAIALSAISSGSIWSLTLYGTLRTVGASGTLQIDGVFRCTESGGLVAIKGFPVGTASPAAIDTTVSNTFNVRVTAGTASASNILATRTFHLSGV